CSVYGALWQPCAYLRPDPAAGTAAEEEHAGGVDTQFGKTGNHVTHSESTAFQHSERHTTHAMRSREATEHPPRPGEPFRRHCTGKCRQEGDSIRPRRCLAGKGVQLLDAGQAKLTDEPGGRPARKTARIFDEVAFAGVSMGLD